VTRIDPNVERSTEDVAKAQSGIFEGRSPAVLLFTATKKGKPEFGRHFKLVK
jgi:hypothetical protein